VSETAFPSRWNNGGKIDSETYLEETLPTIIRILFEIHAFPITVSECRIGTLAIATRLRSIRESTSSPAIDAVSVCVGLESTFPMGECVGCVKSIAGVDVTGSEGVVAAFECSGAGI
jgi:hypothetical protein